MSKHLTEANVQAKNSGNEAIVVIKEGKLYIRGGNKEFEVLSVSDVINTHGVSETEIAVVVNDKILRQIFTGDVYLAKALFNTLKKSGRELHNVEGMSISEIRKKYGTSFDVIKSNDNDNYARLRCAYKYS